MSSKAIFSTIGDELLQWVKAKQYVKIKNRLSKLDLDNIDYPTAVIFAEAMGSLGYYEQAFQILTKYQENGTNDAAWHYAMAATLEGRYVESKAVVPTQEYFEYLQTICHHLKKIGELNPKQLGEHRFHMWDGWYYFYQSCLDVTEKRYQRHQQLKTQYGFTEDKIEQLSEIISALNSRKNRLDELSAPEELDYVYELCNASIGLTTKIALHPLCDIVTAKKIYWLAAPDYYYEKFGGAEFYNGNDSTMKQYAKQILALERKAKTTGFMNVLEQNEKIISTPSSKIDLSKEPFSRIPEVFR